MKTGIDTQITEQQDRNEAVKMALMQQDIGYIKAKMDDFGKKMDSFSTQFVTYKEFYVIRMIVFGMVATILTTVLLAIVASLFHIGLTK